MAKYRFKDEDLRLWSIVTATVRPHLRHEGQHVFAPTPVDPLVAPVALRPMADLSGLKIGDKAARPAAVHRMIDHLSETPDDIEKNRKRRLSRERDPIEARLDLHGLSQFDAEDQLRAFITSAYGRGLRAVLIITGKGVAQNGLLKRRTPDWLADPRLAPMIAGISQAHARHGGTGALYVALKRSFAGEGSSKNPQR